MERLLAENKALRAALLQFRNEQRQLLFKQMENLEVRRWVSACERSESKTGGIKTALPHDAHGSRLHLPRVIRV